MYALLLLGAFVSLFPFYYMFVQASQPSSEVLRFPPHLWFGASAWTNIRALWDNGFGRALFNSAFIAVTSSALSVMIASMAGYAFAKYRFPGRSLIFGLFLLVLMVPYHVTAVPLFKMMASITWFTDSNWISSYQAVILPALANPFGIFLMRQSMQALPDDLLDAGRIDGASEWRVFWNVAIPTMRPTLAALGIYSFMFQWNSFFWPLIIMRDKAMETLPVRINALVGLSIIDYGQLMMGTALTTLPIMMIFLAFQRQFISGAMAGAVKG
jgi:lactose/L-arabinose transport system permease protein